jgi:hypothetical protein
MQVRMQQAPARIAMSGEASVSTGGTNAQVLDRSALGEIGMPSAASQKNPSGLAFSPNGTLPAATAAQTPTVDPSAKRFQQAIQNLDNEQINLLTRTLATKDFSAAFGDAVTDLLLSADFITLSSYDKTALLTHLQNHPGTLLDHPKPGRDDFATMLSAGRDELGKQRGIARLSPEERQIYEQPFKLSTSEDILSRLEKVRAVNDKVHSYLPPESQKRPDIAHPPGAAITSLEHFGPLLSEREQRLATLHEQTMRGEGPDTTMMLAPGYILRYDGADPKLCELADNILIVGGGGVAPFTNAASYVPTISNDPFYPSAYAEPTAHTDPTPAPDVEAPLSKAASPGATPVATPATYNPAADVHVAANSEMPSGINASKSPANTNALDPSYKLNAPVQLQSKETPIPITREWRSRGQTPSAAALPSELTEPSSSTPHGPQSYADDGLDQTSSSSARNPNTRGMSVAGGSKGDGPKGDGANKNEGSVADTNPATDGIANKPGSSTIGEPQTSPQLAQLEKEQIDLEKRIVAIETYLGSLNEMIDDHDLLEERGSLQRNYIKAAHELDDAIQKADECAKRISEIKNGDGPKGDAANKNEGSVADTNPATEEGATKPDSPSTAARQNSPETSQLPQIEKKQIELERQTVAIDARIHDLADQLSEPSRTQEEGEQLQSQLSKAIYEKDGIVVKRYEGAKKIAEMKYQKYLEENQGKRIPPDELQKMLDLLSSNIRLSSSDSPLAMEKKVERAVAKLSVQLANETERRYETLNSGAKPETIADIDRGIDETMKYKMVLEQQLDAIKKIVDELN